VPQQPPLPGRPQWPTERPLQQQLPAREPRALKARTQPPRPGLQLVPLVQGLVQLVRMPQRALQLVLVLVL
jgi:hypothetical protein